MENYKNQTELFDTASSDFFSKKNQDSVKMTPSIVKNPYDDRCLVQGLQSQISRLREILSANKMRIDRLQCREELKNYVKETNQEFQIIQTKNKGEIAVVKDDFQKNIGSLERESSSIKRQWKNFKEKQQDSLNEAIEELKSVKNQNQSMLTSLFKDTSTELRCKFAAFGREIKQQKKARLQRKSGLMQELDLLCTTFNEKIEVQRKKRGQYQQIVLVLLDKTCEQGQKILRRIC